MCYHVFTLLYEPTKEHLKRLNCFINLFTNFLYLSHDITIMIHKYSKISYPRHVNVNLLLIKTKTTSLMYDIFHLTEKRTKLLFEY